MIQPVDMLDEILNLQKILTEDTFHSGLRAGDGWLNMCVYPERLHRPGWYDSTELGVRVRHALKEENGQCSR